MVVKKSVAKKKVKPVEAAEFRSTHGLDFLVAPDVMPGFQRFKVGSCGGTYTATKDAYQIVAVVNRNCGNGHLNDVFDWFENSSRRDNKDLMVMQLWNKGFKKHLIEKRGFVQCPYNDLDGDHVVKKFKNK